MIDRTLHTLATRLLLVAGLGCSVCLSSCSTPPPSTWSAPFDTTRLVPRSSVYTTTDGGRSWQRAGIAQTDVLYDITRTGHGAWIAVGADGVIMRSSEPTRGWAAVASVTTAHLRGVSSNLTRGILIAVGQAGTILRSTDGSGTTWSTVTSGTTEYLNAVTATSFVAIAVGSNGTILRSTDWGASWTSLASPTTSDLASIAIGSIGEYYAVGNDGAAIVSSDEGVTWRNMSVPVVRRNDWLTAVISPAPRNVWIAGYRHVTGRPTTNGIVMRTLDGGGTWSIDTSANGGTGDEPFEGLYGMSAYADRVITVGRQTASYMLTAGAPHWAPGGRPDTSVRMTRVMMFGENEAVAVGE